MNERERRRPDPVIEAYRAGIDRTLLRENLKLTPEERILKLMELQRLAEELRRAGEAVRAQDFDSIYDPENLLAEGGSEGR